MSSSRAFFAVALLVSGAAGIRAASIPIMNASFETPPVKPEILSTGGIPGWTFFKSPDATGVVGVANLAPGTFTFPTDGSQVGYLSASGNNFSRILGIFQALDAKLEANTLYTLSVDFYIGKPPIQPPVQNDTSVRLGAGNGPIALAQLAARKAEYGQTTTLTFFAPPNDPNLGKPILIQIDMATPISPSDSFHLFFDNVRLEASPVIAPVVHGAFCCGGISPEEIARLNVYCDGSVMPVPCNATLEFHDVHGVLLKQADLILRPGETGFLELPPTAKGREPMDVIVRWFLAEGSADFSLEVFDSENLRTRFFVNWGDGSVAKTGNLDSGPASLAHGDTGRLKVYCDGSVRVEGALRFESCQASLSFHDVNGRVLKQSRMTLAPGTAGFLDLSFDETRSMDRRAVVIPSLTVSGGPAVGSFALLDTATGITITQSYPAEVQSVGR